MGGKIITIRFTSLHSPWQRILFHRLCKMLLSQSNFSVRRGGGGWRKAHNYKNKGGQLDNPQVTISHLQSDRGGRIRTLTKQHITHHVCEFMSDDRRDSLLDPNGGNEGVVEQRRLPVRDQAPVLHRPGVKVRQSYLVYRERGSSMWYINHQPWQCIQVSNSRPAGQIRPTTLLYVAVQSWTCVWLSKNKSLSLRTDT